MALVAPSMLAADFLHLEKDVRTVNEYADLFHMDIMDGRLVPNISFGFPVLESVAKIATKPLDVHLMIIHPEVYVERFAKAGAQMISFHLEASKDPEPILGLIKSNGAKAGLVINPDKPVESLFPYLQDCDFVLLMSVFAGFGGQAFIESTYERVRTLKNELVKRGLDKVQIEVDGGVNAKNAPLLRECGADILVAGSSVFKSDDPESVINAIRG